MRSQLPFQMILLAVLLACLGPQFTSSDTPLDGCWNMARKMKNPDNCCHTRVLCSCAGCPSDGCPTTFLRDLCTNQTTECPGYDQLSIQDCMLGKTPFESTTTASTSRLSSTTSAKAKAPIIRPMRQSGRTTALSKHIILISVVASAALVLVTITVVACFCCLGKKGTSGSTSSKSKHERKTSHRVNLDVSREVMTQRQSLSQRNRSHRKDFSLQRREGHSHSALGGSATARESIGKCSKQGWIAGKESSSFPKQSKCLTQANSFNSRTVNTCYVSDQRLTGNKREFVSQDVAEIRKALLQ